MGVADIGLLGILLSIIVLITFFVMSSRLGSIKETLKTLLNLELQNPVNRIIVECSKCKEKYSVSVLRKNELVNCPKCKESNRVL